MKFNSLSNYVPGYWEILTLPKMKNKQHWYTREVPTGGQWVISSDLFASL